MSRLRLAVTEQLGLTFVWVDPEFPSLYEYECSNEKVNAFLTARNSEQLFDAIEDLGCPLLPSPAASCWENGFVPMLLTLEAAELDASVLRFFASDDFDAAIEMAADDLEYLDLPKDSRTALKRSLSERWFDGYQPNLDPSSVLYIEPLAAWWLAYKMAYEAANENLKPVWLIQALSKLQDEDRNRIGWELDLDPFLKLDHINFYSLYALLIWLFFWDEDNTELKSCRECSRPFLADRRRSKLFCSNACKVQAHRERAAERTMASSRSGNGRRGDLS